MTQEVLGRLDDHFLIANEPVDFIAHSLVAQHAPFDFSRMYNAAIEMMLDTSTDPWIEKTIDKI